MKKFLILVLFLVSLTGTLSAQNRKFDNVLYAQNRGSGPIIESEKLVGYYAFYRYDKAGKKTDSYYLQIMDENLNLVKTIDIERPERQYLVETVFNGEVFVACFYDYKKTMEFVSYDRKGKKTGSVLVEDLPKMERYRLSTAANDEEMELSSTIFNAGNTGFIRQGYIKADKTGYVLGAYDNNLKQKWMISTPENTPVHEMIDVLYTSEKHILAQVVRMKSATNRDMDVSLMYIDAVTGKKLFEKSMKDKNLFSVVNAFIDEVNNEVVVFGEYFPLSEDIYSSKSEGVYAASLSEDGTIKKINKMSWTAELSKYFQSEEKSKASAEKLRTFFHRIYRTPDGGLVAIGEQYKKAASAMGIASQVLNGGQGSASVVQMSIQDMVLMQVDKDLKLTSLTSYPKKKTNVMLPPGAGYASSSALAAYIKTIGGFDYYYSSANSDKSKITTVYSDYDRKNDEGKKVDVALGVINYEDKKVTTEKATFNSDAKSFRIYLAKPGYVAIREYYKKKKAIVFRLEKVTYL